MKRRIEFQPVALPLAGRNNLRELDRLLAGIENRMQNLQKLTAQASIGGAGLSRGALEQRIKDFSKRNPVLSTANLSQLFKTELGGLKQADVDKLAADFKDKLSRGLMKTKGAKRPMQVSDFFGELSTGRGPQQVFKSPSKAAQFFESVFGPRLQAAQTMQQFLAPAGRAPAQVPPDHVAGAALLGKGKKVLLSIKGSDVLATVTGMIPLNVLAGQIEAKVTGPIALNIPGEQVRARTLRPVTFVEKVGQPMGAPVSGRLPETPARLAGLPAPAQTPEPKPETRKLRPGERFQPGGGIVGAGGTVQAGNIQQPTSNIQQPVGTAALRDIPTVKAKLDAEIERTVKESLKGGRIESIKRALSPFATETVVQRPGLDEPLSITTREQTGKEKASKLREKINTAMEKELAAHEAVLRLAKKRGDDPEALRMVAQSARGRAGKLESLRQKHEEALGLAGDSRVAPALAQRSKKLAQEAQSLSDQAAALEKKVADQQLAAANAYREKVAKMDQARQKDLQKRSEALRAFSEKQTKALITTQALTLREAEAEAALQTYRARGMREMVQTSQRTSKAGRTIETAKHTFTGGGERNVVTVERALPSPRPSPAGGGRGGNVPPRLPGMGAAAGGDFLGGSISSKPFEEVNRAGKSLLGTMAANTLKLATWHVGLLAFYGTLGLAAKALMVMTDAGLQTARLSQVFRGVGGSASDLAHDVMGLASAEGRSRAEAVASAIEWSRLGLTRRQVNEAVAVSLKAANVAETDAATSTAFFQAMMKQWGLQVRELNGVLNVFNSISNTGRVKVSELMDAFRVSGDTAQRAGFTWQEYAGIVGAAVERTKQSGTQIGNAMKSVLTNLGSPQIQEFLRQQIGVEVTVEGTGELKGMSENLANLWERYQDLNNAQRQFLIFQVAGRFQANRFTAILESYVRGQVMAINAQLDLNSAEAESAKIRATLSSRLKGLGAEVERLVVGGSSGLERTLAESAEAARLMVHWLSEASRLFQELDKAQPKWMRELTRTTNVSLLTRLLSTGVADIIEAAPRAEYAFRVGVQTFAPQSGIAVQHRLDENLKEADQLRQRALAAGQTGRLLGQLQKKLPGMNATQRETALENLSGLKSIPDAPALAAALRGALESGTPIESILGEQIEVQKAANQKLLGERMGKIQEARQEAEGKIGDIMERPGKAQTQQGKDELAAWNGELQRIDASAQAVFHDFNEINEQLDEAAGHFQRVRNMAAGLQQTLGAISDFYSSMPATTSLGRLEMDVEGLKEQENFLRAREKYLIETPEFGKNQTERDQAVKAVREERAQVEAQIYAKTDPALHSRAERGDRANITRRLTEARTEAMGTGATQFEQLLSRERALMQDIAKLESEIALARLQGRDTETQTIRLQQERVDLNKTQLEIEEELIRAKKRQADENRKLLTAGPAEMLRNIAAQRFVQRFGGNLGAPQAQRFFFSQSSEMREAILEARGRNLEQFRRPKTEEQLRSEIARREAQNANDAARLGGRPTPPQPGQFPAVEAAKTAMAFRTVTGQALAFGERLDTVTTVVGKFGMKLEVIMSDLEALNGNKLAGGPPWVTQMHSGLV